MKTLLCAFLALSVSSVVSAGDADTWKKLKTIVVREISFKDVDLNAAMRYLRQESKRLDPSGEGVNFIVRGGKTTAKRRITLELNNIPLGDVVRYVCLLAGLDRKIERGAVIMGPKGSLGGPMTRQTFRLPHHVVDALGKDPKGKKQDKDSDILTDANLFDD